MPEQPGWREYFYPETLIEHPGGVVQGTLRNLLGERDEARLSAIEYSLTLERRKALTRSPGLVAPTRDAAEVRAIHAWLFQDVYEWAGRYRTVDIAKEGSVFAPHGAGIDAVLTTMTRHNARVPWEQLDRGDLVACTARTIALLNYAHPFREGNGRTTKAFLDRLTAAGAYTMSWSAVPLAQWNEACRHAMPLPGSARTRPASLEPVLARIIRPRNEGPGVSRARGIFNLAMPAGRRQAASSPGRPPAPRKDGRAHRQDPGRSL